MTTIHDINEQITEAKVRRAAAVAAEQQRIDQERRNQIAIQEADAELEKLGRQRRAASVEQMQGHCADLLTENSDDVMALRAAMDVLLNVFTQQVLPAFEAARSSYMAQRRATQETMHFAADNPATRANPTMRTNLHGRQQRDQREVADFVRHELGAALANIPTGTAPAYAVIEWVNGAKTDDERTARRRLVSSLLRPDFDPEHTYNPGRSYSAERNTRREIETAFVSGMRVNGGAS